MSADRQNHTMIEVQNTGHQPDPHLRVRLAELNALLARYGLQILACRPKDRHDEEADRCRRWSEVSP